MAATTSFSSKKPPKGLADVTNRKFEATSLILIAVSLVSMSAETMPGLGEPMRRWLGWIEIAITALFTIEYALRVHADRRYVTSAWGCVDVLAILPVWLGFAFPWVWDGSQALRMLRLVRVFKIFALGKLGSTARALGEALGQVRTEIVVSISGSVLVMYVSSMLVFYAERAAQPDAFKSVFHAMWWSVATLTTVGYGDMYPVTVSGKLFAILTMLVGIGMFGAVAGIMTNVMLRMATHLNEDR